MNRGVIQVSSVLMAKLLHDALLLPEDITVVRVEVGGNLACGVPFIFDVHVEGDRIKPVVEGDAPRTVTPWYEQRSGGGLALRELDGVYPV